MTEKDDGGPAFPHKAVGYSTQGNTFEKTECGMSLRDWFAGQALNGIMSKTSLIPGKEIDAFRLFSEASYAVADAMLKARKGE